MIQVALVHMPFAAVERPSLGLGALKASLSEQCISSAVYYANVEFAARIGLRSYYYISNLQTKNLIGDWIFSACAFPKNAESGAAFLSECQMRGIPVKILAEVKRHVPEFIDDLANRIVSISPKIVGCSSTFQQHCASLALLKRIKALRPDIVTVMGGANCDGSMGIVTQRHFHWIDFVVSGEADDIFPLLCDLVFRYGASVPRNMLPTGIIGDANNTLPPEEIGRAQVEDLDKLPFPNFTEYFPALADAGLVDSIVPGLIMESSRGCWWGQHEQCVFCGINLLSIKHRVKKAEHILSEIDALVSIYNISRIEFSDYIIPMQYFSTLLPTLAKRPDTLHLMFETTACLRDEHIRLLSEAGVTWIQAGIENFDDDLLRLLNKGSAAWKNIQLLKSCQKYGVFIMWNYLANIPGDTVESYERVIDWLPWLFHLQPPCAFGKLRYDRFSPIHRNAQEMGLKLEPNWPYKFVYPLPTDALNDFAYFFQADSKQGVQISERKTKAFITIESIIEDWKKLYVYSRNDIVMTEISPERPLLQKFAIGDELIIKDTRPCSVAKQFNLKGTIAEIYLACDHAPTMDDLIKHLNETRRVKRTQYDIDRDIEYLVERKLLLKLHDRLISLAVESVAENFPTHDDYPGGLVRIPRQQPVYL